MLQFLANVAKGVPQKLEVLLQLVGSLFDLSPGISNYMKVRYVTVQRATTCCVGLTDQRLCGTTVMMDTMRCA
jgi:hypothetical protein